MAENVNLVETEFILREAQQHNIPIRLHGAGKTISARIVDIKRDSIFFSLQEAEKKNIGAWETLSAYFDFRGTDMTFSSKTVRFDRGQLVLAYPEHLLRSPARKHPRVPCPKGFSLEIMLENEKVHLNYPQCGEYSDVSLPDLREGFDITSMNTLVESFRARLSGMATESKVVLFKERAPETIEEILLAHFGKTLFIPSTKSALPSEDPYPEPRIITAAMVSEYEGASAIMEGSRFERALVSKIGRAVNAEVWCPIQYFQYVVGYVYLANKADRPISMDFSVVDYAWEFSRILAYYLKTQNYFKPNQKSEPITHAAAIVDLSASGCLLSIPKTTLSMRIKTGSLLDMNIKHPEGVLSSKGRVVRRFDDKEGAYYGVSFLDLEEKDLLVLYPEIYEIPYSGLEEGGGEARMTTREQT